MQPGKSPGAMKVVLDCGAVTWLIGLALQILGWFITFPALQPPLDIIATSLLAVPAVFFLLYMLSHMIGTGNWGWLASSLLLAPILVPTYYFEKVRATLGKHGTRQGFPTDRPRPAGSGGA